MRSSSAQVMKKRLYHYAGKYNAAFYFLRPPSILPFLTFPLQFAALSEDVWTIWRSREPGVNTSLANGRQRYRADKSPPANMNELSVQHTVKIQYMAHAYTAAVPTKVSCSKMFDKSGCLFAVFLFRIFHSLCLHSQRQ